MPLLSRLTARGGLRAKILAAPVVALALMAAMGAVTVAKLNSTASLAGSMADRTSEVEILRDSNSRQFESDRRMYIALNATDAKVRAAEIKEALFTLKEAHDGYATFTRSAVTPQLRSLGANQVRLMDGVRAARVPVLRTIAAGGTVSGARLAAVEQRVDAADGANDTLVAAEQKVVDSIDARTAATVAAAKRLVIVLLLLALIAASAIAFFVVRAIMRGVRQVLVAAEGIAEGDLDQHVDVATRDEIGRMAGAFGRMVDYLRESAGVAARVADGDLTVEVTPRSPRDVLGNAFARMITQLRDLAGKLSGSAQSLSAASQQMATTSEEA
ncbi:MAG: methyl-accepting chemotaxis protein, partial [Solirubrobacteraceae bacterium]|nr:methyl-accepting chemotaxis protein [Solirubrobacteraceae bacterium]